jgi:hypothetical protein
MTQDPNSNYGTDPQNPYGSAPQDPYEVPSPSPYPPYNPPSSSEQSPYPSPSPYPPPSQPPYWQQPGYGYGYSPPHQGFGYHAPPSSPLPLGEALRQLPKQYIKMLTKPSAASFAEEMGKANWDIVWVQLLGYAVLAAIFNYLIILINSSFGGLNNLPASSPITPTAIQAIELGFSLGTIVLIPISQFIVAGIYYGLSKAFKGQGTFLAQMYDTLLFQVPLGLIILVLELIPVVGIYLGGLVGIYGIVLFIFMLMGVHRLSGGKATLVYFIPVIVAVLLACIFGIAIAILITSALKSTP